MDLEKAVQGFRDKLEELKAPPVTRKGEWDGTGRMGRLSGMGRLGRFSFIAKH